MEKQKSVLYSKHLHHEFEKTNLSLMLGLIIISIGLYIIYWIYVKNKEFEALDHDAPESNRGAIIMMVIPFVWFFIMYFLKGSFFGFFNKIFSVIELFGWILVIFILLKYLLDFCISFGTVTQTRGILWFLPFLFGIVGAIGRFLGSYYFLLFLISPIIVVLAMQNELNLFYEKYRQKKDKSVFYH